MSVKSSATEVGIAIDRAASRLAAACCTPSHATALAVPASDSPTSATRAIDPTGREVGPGVRACWDPAWSDELGARELGPGDATGSLENRPQPDTLAARHRATKPTAGRWRVRRLMARLYGGGGGSWPFSLARSGGSTEHASGGPSGPGQTCKRVPQGSVG